LVIKTKITFLIN